MRFTSILSSALLATTAIAAPSSSSPHPSTKDVAVDKRQDSDFNLTIYYQPKCQGEIFFFPNWKYEEPMIQPLANASQSISLSRDLGTDETLEIRKLEKFDFCGKLISGLRPNTPAGCYPLFGFPTCFVLVKVQE